MIFVRTGPRFLFLRTPEKELLADRLVAALEGKVTSFDHAVEESSEANTIVFIATSKTGDYQSNEVLLLPVGSSVALITLFNEGLSSLVTRADLGPGLLLQRLPQGGTKVMERVREHYGAVALSLKEAIFSGGANDTVIVFTDRPVSRPVRVAEVLEPVLLVNCQVPVMYRELRREAVRYFTAGLEGGQWHEVRINIYDTSEQYDLHYKRLALALEDLEAGLILGETWTRDHALALFSVVAYQVRLFTAMAPVELKQVLLGLEYDARGERFVDLDLYYRRRKVEKNEVIKYLPPDAKGVIYFREWLWARLAPETRARIRQLEEKLAGA